MVTMKPPSDQEKSSTHYLLRLRTCPAVDREDRVEIGRRRTVRRYCCQRPFDHLRNPRVRKSPLQKRLDSGFIGRVQYIRQVAAAAQRTARQSQTREALQICDFEAQPAKLGQYEPVDDRFTALRQRQRE